MNLVTRLAIHFDVSEYQIFRWAADSQQTRSFINVASDYTVWRTHGIIPLYVFSYNRMVKCCA